MEPRLVPGRSETPEKDAIECSDAAKHLHWGRLQFARARALLHALRAHARLSPPTCKLTLSFRSRAQLTHLDTDIQPDRIVLNMALDPPASQRRPGRIVVVSKYTRN